MFDRAARKLIDPALEAIARRLVDLGVTANAVTLAGFALGAAAGLCIALQAPLAGLVLILASRLCDGLDGAVARLRGSTDFGGYLDIVLDFAFYGLIPLAFAIADPVANGMAASVLLLAFYVNGASFLAYAIISEKRGLAAPLRGPKTFLYSAGLAEASETLAIFCAMCLFPSAFPLLAWLFAGLTAWTALARILLARTSFR